MPSSLFCSLTSRPHTFEIFYSPALNLPVHQPLAVKLLPQRRRRIDRRIETEQWMRLKKFGIADLQLKTKIYLHSPREAVPASNEDTRSGLERHLMDIGGGCLFRGRFQRLAESQALPMHGDGPGQGAGQLLCRCVTWVSICPLARRLLVLYGPAWSSVVLSCPLWSSCVPCGPVATQPSWAQSPASGSRPPPQVTGR